MLYENLRSWPLQSSGFTIHQRMAEYNALTILSNRINAEGFERAVAFITLSNFMPMPTTFSIELLSKPELLQVKYITTALNTHKSSFRHVPKLNNILTPHYRC